METRQFVSFRLAGRLLGLDIRQVREINRALDITPVQHARPHVRGLLNLRGQIVTVFDLGRRLGLGSQKITAETHNVVLKADDVALLVDAVGESVEVPPEQIEPPPANPGGIADGFIQEVVKLHGDLLVVLSVEKILALD
ncbi:MAG: chemotaxis protein CheW [Pseudomonadota bacterium]